MKKISAIFIVIVVVVISIGTIFYLFLPGQFYDIFDNPVISPIGVSVFIDGEELSMNKEGLLVVDSLNPEIVVRHFDRLEVKGVLWDKKINLLSKTYMLEGMELSEFRNELKIRLPFSVSPASHSLDIKTVDRDNRETVYPFSFLLGIRSEFDESLDNSDFFIVPDSTRINSPESWLIKDGNLRVLTPSSGYASLAFIYPFRDVFVSFWLIPNESPLNLVFYFLESGRSIVIGNGNNRRITLLRGDPYSGSAVDGKTFLLEPFKKYLVFISREQNIYKVHISEEKDGYIFSKSAPILEFIDDSFSETKEESIGIAIWEGSKGFNIDNLVVSPFSHF